MRECDALVVGERGERADSSAAGAGEVPRQDLPSTAIAVMGAAGVGSAGGSGVGSCLVSHAVMALSRASPSKRLITRRRAASPGGM